ncbi:MAG: radical SAM protein [Clostridium sp.]
MNISFWITKQCNLNCTYCYVNKENKKMNFDIAKEAIEFSIREIKNSNDKKIKISLHGGEPFLNLEVARFIVDNIKNNISKEKELLFTLTTNGTLLNKDIISFIKEHINYSFSVSLDGVKEVNDKNRIYINGQGTFDDVMRNLNTLKESGVNPRIRTTVTPETVNNLFETFKYFHELGHYSVSSVLDFTNTSWSKEDILKYYTNLDKILSYLQKYDNNNFRAKLSNIKKATFKEKNKCGAGKSSFHINYNGDIYPCSYSMSDEKNIIGNVQEGINKKSIETIDIMNSKEVLKCNNCFYKKFCDGNRCKYINLRTNKDANVPNDLHCYLNQINHKVITNYLEHL